MTSGALQDPFGLAGTVLEGQYRADVVVGEGGFGVVYRGRHLSLDQPIAIKVLKGLDGGDPTINALVLEKFRAEAKLLYTLSQSSLHIVRCLDFGATTTPSGAWAPFMILEWLDGKSLADDLIERRNRGMRGRSVQEALALLEPVADGLAIAHQRHVAHRDVKPANIFLLHGGRPGAQGQVKVLDFGIAKIMKDGESAGTKGTFASFTWLYAAPEQLDPRLGQTGLATDVYGFGLLLTELLTDRKPIDDRDVVGIMKTATNPTRRPTPRARGANVPDEIEAVCQRALAVDPRHRFPTIMELWAALSTAREGRGSMTTAAQAVVPPSVVVTPASSNPAMTSAPANPMAATGIAPSGMPTGSPMPSSMQAPSAHAASVMAPSGPAAPGYAHQHAASSTPQHAQTALPMSAPYPPTGGPPLGTRPPGFTPPMGPPPNMGPAPGFGGPMMPYQQASPPFGTMPPGGRPVMRRLPFVRADGTSPVVVLTIVFFILTLLFAGTCAVVHGACTS